MEQGARNLLPPVDTYISTGFKRFGVTMKMIRQFKDLSVFLISVFFAMAGIYIVVAFAFIYGDQVVGWDDSVRVLMFVIVQITAAAGAFAFGLIQDRIGCRVTYMLTL